MGADAGAVPGWEFGTSLTFYAVVVIKERNIWPRARTWKLELDWHSEVQAALQWLGPLPWLPWLPWGPGHLTLRQTAGSGPVRQGGSAAVWSGSGASFGSCAYF